MSKKASKSNRKSTQVKLVSTADTGFYYIGRRNMTQKKDKMEFKKYDPVVRKHVLFKEKKISS
jgi:large subunit ribosomal protein L33|tara:strand:- start:20286 stop:20474 length:189 start_codon:yes stop_codon:yes gene_type:complete